MLFTASIDSICDTAVGSANLYKATNRSLWGLTLAKLIKGLRVFQVSKKEKHGDQDIRTVLF